jgi:hypothetical protein
MFKFVNAVAGIALALSSTSVLAAATVADLTNANGKVLVDVGQGFVPVDGLVSLKAGDKVFVGAESAAQVDFKSGCAVSVSESSTLVISKTAPCADGQVSAVVGKKVLAPAGGPFESVVAEEPGVCSGSGILACGAPALLPLLLIGGGAIGVTAYAINKNDNNGGNGGGGGASDEAVDF